MAPDDGRLRIGSHPANTWISGETAVDISRGDPRAPRKVQVAAAPREVVIDLNRSAIVVVDMQNDFCADDGHLGRGGLDCSGARRLIAPINRMLQAARPQHVPILWLSWSVRPDRLDMNPSMPHIHAADPHDPLLRRKGGWGAFAGTRGAEIADGLDVDGRDIHVLKHRFSGFVDTQLDSILRNMGVTTLFFAGVATDICVLATLQDAVFLGYDAVMVTDCVTTSSPDFCVRAATYHVEELLGFTCASEALIEGMGRSPSSARDGGRGVG